MHVFLSSDLYRIFLCLAMELYTYCLTSTDLHASYHSSTIARREAGLAIIGSQYGIPLSILNLFSSL